jgi:hypothetical protein
MPLPLETPKHEKEHDQLPPHAHVPEDVRPAEKGLSDGLEFLVDQAEVFSDVSYIWISVCLGSRGCCTCTGSRRGLKPGRKMYDLHRLAESQGRV